MPIKFFGLGLLVALIAVLAACGGDDPTRVPTVAPTVAVADTGVVAPTEVMEERGPVKIGVLTPTTGVAASVGIDELNGALLYFEQQNMEIAGRQIEVLEEDGACNPEIGLPKMRKLIERDEVDAVIGPVCSSVGFAVRDMVIRSGTPIIFPIPGNIEESGDPERVANIFRVDYEAQVVPGYHAIDVYNRLGVRKILWLAFDYSAGHYITASFIPNFEELGGEVVSQAFVPLDIIDFGPFLGGVDPDEVDAIVAFVFGGGSIQLMKQARDFGLTPDVQLIVLSVLDDNLVNQVGDAGEGVITFSHYTPHDDNPVNIAFVDAYVERFGQLPSAWSVDGWLAAKAIGDAIVALDGDISDKAAFSAAIQNVSFDSPRGPFVFEENGFAVVTMYIMKAVRAPTGELQIIRQGEDVGTFNSSGLITP